MSPAKINTADQAWVRRTNRTVILSVFRTRHSISRAKLATETGLNPSTVSSIIGELIQENLIRETDFVQSATGRPGRLLELNPDGGSAIGIEINVDYIEIIVTDFAAKVLWRKRLLSSPSEGQDAIMARVIQYSQEAYSFIKEKGSRLIGIGVGVPGLVDVPIGRLRLAPNLGWENVPIRDILLKYFDCPIYVENEANAAALGEYYFGAAKNIKDFIYLSAGVGLGSGILIGGKLFRGLLGHAGEAGHMTLDVNGELCGCGRRGCLETFVGPRAVEKRVQNSIAFGARSILQEKFGGNLDRIAFEDVVEAAKMGDQTSIDALDKVAFYLGIGITNLINLFDVEVIVLGGALNIASPLLIDEIKRIVKKNKLDPNSGNLTIIPSAHGSDACVMGAVALILDDILREASFS